MKLNPHIKAVAVAAVKSEESKQKSFEIPEYPAMFVAEAAHADQQGVQQIVFFECDGVRYTIGPKKKLE